MEPVSDSLEQGRLWLERVTSRVEGQLAFHGAATRLVEAMSADELVLLLTPGLAQEATISESRWRLFLAGWRRVVAERDEDWECATRIASWLDALPGATHRHAVSLANWLGSDTRGFQYRPTAAQWSALSADDRVTPGQVFVGALYAYRPRFMYQFNEVQDVLESLPALLRGHAIFVALEAYALLGIDVRRNQAEAMTAAVRAEAMARKADCGCLEDVVDVCVQAFDLAQNADHMFNETNPDAEVLPLTTIDMVESYLQGDFRQDTDMASVFYWRRARARRRLAFLRRDRVAEATDLISRGIRDLATAQDRLRSDNDFSQEFAERLILERESFERDIHVIWQMREMNDAASRVLESESRIQKEGSSASIRSVEVLSLFSSAVAFAVGVAAIGATADSLKAGILIGLFLLIGLVSFSVLLMVTSSVAMSVLGRSQGDSDAPRSGFSLPIALSGAAMVAALVCIAIVVYEVAK